MTSLILRMARAFDRQRGTARRRGIDWFFTFDEWRAWWLEDSRWERRGVHRGSLGMCRFNDVGPYALGNVFAGTPADNSADRAPGDRKAAAAKAWATQRARGQESHLKDRENHPRARRCLTPRGAFESAALAADAYGLTRQRIGQLCRAGRNGWSYV